MSTFTVFCREASGTGTTWISAVEAKSVEEAKTKGHANCVSDWGWDDSPGDVVVIGVAKGDVEIVEWDDNI